MGKYLSSLRDASEVVLECRDLGHAWKHQNDPILTYNGRDILSFTRVDVCLRCECVRVRELEVPSMRVVKSRMNYPNNYLMKHGKGVRRSDARMEAFDRFVRSMK